MGEVIGVSFWGGPPRPAQEAPIRASEYLFSLLLSRYGCSVYGEGRIGHDHGLFRP